METPPASPLPNQPSILRQIWRRDKIALTLIFLIMLLDVIGMTILFPISAYIVRQYSDQALMITLLSVIYSAAQFFAAPVIGKISDRLGRRPVLLVCLAGAGLGYLMFGIGGALWILFLSRLIAGITGGSISTASAYIVDVSKPEELANAFTLVGMAWGIGLVLGPALGGALGQINLSAPAYFSAALALGNMVLCFFYLPESLPKERRESKAMRVSDFNAFQSIGAIGRLPGLAVILVASALFNFAFNAMNSTETLFLIQKFAVLPWQIGLMTMLVGISIALVQALLVQRMVTRVGEIAVAVFCLLVQVAGAMAMRYNPVFILIYPIAILRSAASGFIFPTLGTLSSRRVSYQEQGVLMGVTSSINGLMGIVSPILAGLLYDYWSPGAPYWLAALFFVGAALLLRTQRPSPLRLEKAAA
jgi:DHA1 family tetracycline resistance protein-like MFS transporter